MATSALLSDTLPARELNATTPVLDNVLADRPIPDPMAIAPGTAGAPPELPSRLLAASVPSAIVPVVVMVPPDSPAPAITLATVPVPDPGE